MTQRRSWFKTMDRMVPLRAFAVLSLTVSAVGFGMGACGSDKETGAASSAASTGTVDPCTDGVIVDGDGAARLESDV